MAELAEQEKKEFVDGMKSTISTTVNTFISTILTQEGLSQQQLYGVLAEERYASFLEAKNLAYTYASRAQLLGDLPSAAQYQAIGDSYSELASSYLVDSSAAHELKVYGKFMGIGGKFMGPAGDIYNFSTVYDKYERKDYDGASAALFGMLTGILTFSVVAAALPAGITFVAVAALAGGIVGLGTEELFPGWETLFDFYLGDSASIRDLVNLAFTQAMNQVVRADPLAAC